MKTHLIKNNCGDEIIIWILFETFQDLNWRNRKDFFKTLTSYSDFDSHPIFPVSYTEMQSHPTVKGKRKKSLNLRLTVNWQKNIRLNGKISAEERTSDHAVRLAQHVNTYKKTFTDERKRRNTIHRRRTIRDTDYQNIPYSFNLTEKIDTRSEFLDRVQHKKSENLQWKKLPHKQQKYFFIIES